MNPNIDLEALEKERQEITDFLSQPNAYADANFAAKNRRLQELEELITLGKKRIQLQNDIKEAENDPELAEMKPDLENELSETETLLQKLEDSRQSQMYAIRDIEEIKERLLSFGKYAENAAPDVIVTLIQTFVERIYITDENDERHCHIFIKGCSKEDYDDFFRVTGYIENTQETGAVTSVLPVCDSDECCKLDMVSNRFTVCPQLGHTAVFHRYEQQGQYVQRCSVKEVVMAFISDA